jgi:hypothetical protein
MHQQEVLLVHLVCRDTDNDLLISLSVHKVANWLFSVLGLLSSKQVLQPLNVALRADPAKMKDTGRDRRDPETNNNGDSHGGTLYVKHSPLR